jgi:predicted ArsR family transcriptional regulator
VQPALSDGHVTLLKLLADLDDYLSADHIAAELGISVQKARYLLEGLVDANYLSDLIAVDRETLYRLDKAGRTLLVERGLL